MKQAAGSLLPLTKKDEKEGLKETATDTAETVSLEILIQKYQSDRDTLKKKNLATATRKDSGLNFWREKFGAADMLTTKNSQLSEFAQ